VFIGQPAGIHGPDNLETGTIQNTFHPLERVEAAGGVEYLTGS